MTRHIGKNAIITFGGVTLNTDYRTLKQSGSTDTVEKSAGADAHKSMIGSILDDTFSLEALLDGTAGWVACAPQTEGTFIVSPEGTTAGKPKTTVVAMVTKREKSIAYNDLESMTVEFQAQSTPVEGTN